MIPEGDDWLLTPVKCDKGNGIYTVLQYYSTTGRIDTYAQRISSAVVQPKYVQHDERARRPVYVCLPLVTTEKEEMDSGLPPVMICWKGQRYK